MTRNWNKLGLFQKSRVRCFRVGCKTLGTHVMHKQSNDGHVKYVRTCRLHRNSNSGSRTVVDSHRFSKAGYRKCSRCKEEDFPEKAVNKLKGVKND